MVQIAMMRTGSNTITLISLLVCVVGNITVPKSRWSMETLPVPPGQVT